MLDDLSTGRRENLNPRATLMAGDIADAAVVARCMADADGVFHLAAIASVARANEAWAATHRTNLTGTIVILDAARRANARGPIPVVYASSAAVYGDNDALPLSETVVTRPLSAYGADKLGCELHARVAGHVHGVATTGLRFFNVFGPRQDPSSPYSGVISIFCDRLRRGQNLTVYGTGLQQRDFVYVADVVRALIAAMESPATTAPVYNVCTGVAISILELAQTLGSLFGREPVFEFKAARPGDIARSLGSALAIRRALGWEPRVSLAAGLVETVYADDVPAFTS